MNKGLLPLPKDKRDYSHHLTFGSISASDLPPNGPELIPLEYNQQGNTNFCTAEATSENAELVWDIKFSPEYSMMSINRIMGKSTDGGADLRSAMKAGINYGFLPREYSPFTLGIQDSNFIVNPTNWKDLDKLDAIAAKYKEDSFFTVDGPKDIFDNIRIAQWQACQDINDNKRTVIVGTEWFEQWNTIGPDGIIPMPKHPSISLHCYLNVTWVTKNGVQYLMCQNSEGSGWGDGGKGYFPREIVDKYFDEGAFIYRKNPDPNQIQTLSTIVSLLSKLVTLLYKFFPPSTPATPVSTSVNQESPSVVPQPVTPIPTSIAASRIPDWARAVQVAEGWYLPGQVVDGILYPKGSVSYQMHNPGNLKYSDLTASWGGAKGELASDGGYFCYFTDESTGFVALCNFLQLGAKDELIAFHEARTLADFTEVYAHPTKLPNGSIPYLNTICNQLKVAPTILVKNLL